MPAPYFTLFLGANQFFAAILLSEGQEWEERWVGNGIFGRDPVSRWMPTQPAGTEQAKPSSEGVSKTQISMFHFKNLLLFKD